MKIDAVIFDLDGLLIDSEPVWRRAYKQFATSHHFIDDPGLYPKMIGRGLREIIEILIGQGLKGDVDDLTEEYRKVFYEIISQENKNLLFGGADDLLMRFEKKRLKLAVATGGHAKDNCSEILKKVVIFKYFDVVVSSDDVDEGKPAPDVYLETSRQLGIEPLKCLVLEDAANGVVAAKAAGMWVFGVNANASMRQQLEEAGANKVYSNLSDIEIP